MILLDTSVLIGGDRLEATETYAASILTRAELQFGVSVAKTPRIAAHRQARLRQLDGIYEWLPFTREDTMAYGVLAGAMHRKAPAQARRLDTYIAAQALRLGVPFMSRNARDFRHVTHLVTILEPGGG